MVVSLDDEYGLHYIVWSEGFYGLCVTLFQTHFFISVMLLVYPGFQGHIFGKVHARRGQCDRVPVSGLQQAYCHKTYAALEQTRSA